MIQLLRMLLNLQIVVSLDLVNCFERIASHAANVALHVMKRASADQNFDEMHGHSSDAATEEYQALYTYYESRYLLPVSKAVPETPVIPDPENYADLKYDEHGHAILPETSAEADEKKQKKEKEKEKEAKKDKASKNGKKTHWRCRIVYNTALYLSAKYPYL